MKTPSSSGKKKKKISGVSPSMDLTRFGFSVKKRSASEAAASSPPKSASAKNNNNAGNNNEDDNMESPLKRHKVSSPSMRNDMGTTSGNNVGKGKGKENGTATPIDNDKKKSPAAKTASATASRTALYDLTQSSSSEEGPKNKKDGIKVVGDNDDGGAAAKNDELKDANFASLGGLASSIANQIVAASSLRNNTQQQQQQPVKQRRGKRDKVIPNKNKTAVAKSTAITATTKSSSVAKPLSPSKNKSGNNNNNIQALALVRVINPHEITCSTAVANARHQDQKQKQQNNDAKQQQSWTPRRIFNGAILGRSSSSANAKPNFVDLGISNRCMGISRNHITILNVRVKSDNTLPNTVDESQNIVSSQTSATSSASKNSIISQSDQSTVTLQVSGNASNGVNVHRTKRGSRKITFLSQGEKMTLRVGDALEFYSTEKLYYCVVGLESLQGGKKALNVAKSVENENEVVAVVEDEKQVVAATKTTKKRISYGGSTNVDEKKRNLAKLNVTDEAIIVDAKKKSKTDELKAPLKTPRNRTNKGTTLSTAKSASSVEEVEDTPRLPAATSPMSHVKSATKTTVAKRLDKKLQKSPMGPKSPNRATSSDGDDADRAIDDLERSKTTPEQEEGEESEMIKKGDLVKARFEVKDWFGEIQLEWYFGTVTRVKKNRKSSSTRAYEIDVLYADQEKDTLPFPDNDVEKVDGHEYPDFFFVGDSVDCFHQDGLRPGHEGRWYRGRIASISEDGNSCDVLYIDGDYEYNIPTKQEKIRLIKRVDMNGGWVMNKKTTIPVNESSNGSQYRAGLVTSSEGGKFCVKFSDGTSESFDYAEVATGVFSILLKDMPQKDISLWPLSSSSSMASTARLRRQMRDKLAAIKESVSPKPNAAKKSAPSKSAPKVKVERSVNVKMEVTKEPMKPIKREIIRSVLYVKIDLDEVTTNTPMKKGVRSVKRLKVDAGQWQEGASIEEQHNESQDSSDNGNTAGNKRKAKDFPPGLANVIWCALNSPEPQTGANLLRNMLCVQNIVPPVHLAQKLMDLIKYGPKAEGSSVYFKDPLRTQLASSYACALVTASSHLVRKDDSTIFGPSSWDDVEVLLSQSIDQTENTISGRRLAQALQMAACGSKLLSLMLKSELLRNDFSSTSFTFDATSMMKCMPTVKVFKSEGLRNVLKAVVRHTTSCLIRHSKWILDHDLNELSQIERASAECCASEAKTCLESLGSVVCYTAWLFCAEERVAIDHHSSAIIVRDEFLSELTRSIENLPEMSSRKKTTFTKKVKLHFLLSLVEEFAFPLQDAVGKMIGLEDVLDCV
ncbi:hypothetical protein QTG54_004813 [Skeletonema marinoi]|uniref:Tudor domain-containing protein n=1 Tax=Skeletonema marinoi TaxID=267567 RepID=A0AAD8YF33_9STRA|nr:hypothetical protein QTG54_004813 [Skeletonema marinoi]